MIIPLIRRPENRADQGTLLADYRIVQGLAHQRSIKQIIA